VLKVSGVSKAYETEEVLRDVSFVLNDGERIGLVGPNGSGKSTLLRILAGELRPDSGSVWVDPKDTVAYLPQYPLDELHLPVRESLLRGAGRAGELQARVAGLEAAMPRASGEELPWLLEEYGEAREEFERLGGYELDARIETVTRGLELRAELNQPVGSLSGGNKTKLSLARLLLSGASVMLLDEPTNYLDLPALLWLERWVATGAASCVIVSHDRRFLDRTVGAILELDPAAHTARVWSGNYTAYAQARSKERDKQLAAYLDQQAEKRRLEADIRRTKEQARGVERGTQLDTARRYAKKVAKKAKAREHRLERQLAEHEVEKPGRSWGLHLEGLATSADPIGYDRTVLSVRGLRAAYPVPADSDGDPTRREVLKGVDLEVRGRDRVALLGANGSGKSTLLRCVAGVGAVRCEGAARLGSGVRLGWLSQEGDELELGETVYDVFRSRTRMHEDEARTYLHKFLFSGEEVFKQVAELSYGQRAKLALAVLVLGEANFLVLDEPTSHMDMQALEAMEGALAGYIGPMLVVSHDRYFLERVGINRVLVMDAGVLREVDGVEEYEEGLEAGREQRHAGGAG
jgi:ATPase subunit of ABC transporter with duplicated ATPase domains